VGRATTIRFTDDVFARLDQASSWTGMPVNSIVVAAVLEWMQRHTPDPRLPVETFVAPAGFAVPPTRPRWSTIRRAVEQAVGKGATRFYPFARFTATAQELLTSAQAEAGRGGFNYIGTEHLLLAAFANEQSEAAKVLKALGVEEPEVRSHLEKVLHGAKAAAARKIIPTSRVKKVIELAFDVSEQAGKQHVSTAHVLLGVSTEGEGIAAHILKDLGATRNRIASAIDELTESEA
jgi:hypothetical protein